MKSMVLNDKNLQLEIIEYIVKIFKENFNISLNLDINGDDNFFSNNINLSTRNMTYLFFLSEERYNICFTEEEIDSISFYTLNGFGNFILNHIKT